MKLIFYDENYREAWDTFLLKTPGSVFEHQTGWKQVVEKTFGHKGYHMIAMDENGIRGVLPVYLVNHFLFGRFLISIPYCSSTGGVVFDSVEARDLLLNGVINLAKDLDVQYLEIRNHREIYHGLENKDVYWTLTLDLTQEIDTMWNKLSKNTRYYVRRSYRSEFEIRKTLDSLEDFHRVYVENMRDLGTPAWKFQFLEEIRNVFADKLDLITIYKNKKCVGGILLFGYKEMCSDPWASSLRKYFHLFPNYLLYWEAIKLAHEKKFTIYDFGRSTYNSGTFFFKKRFGGVPRKVYYQYYLPSRKKIPDVAPGNPKYKIAIKLWQQLPVSIAGKLGNFFISGIP